MASVPGMHRGKHRLFHMRWCYPLPTDLFLHNRQFRENLVRVDNVLPVASAALGEIWTGRLLAPGGYLDKPLKACLDIPPVLPMN